MLRKGNAFAVLAISTIAITTFTIIASGQEDYNIPSWVKEVAGFWVQGEITDSDFGESLSFLIDNEILKIPKIKSLQNEIERLESENKNLRRNDMTNLLYSSYPEIKGLSVGRSFHDEFNRATLNPKGGYSIYTTTVSGEGKSGNYLGTHRSLLLLTTGGTIGDYVDVRLEEYWLERQKGPDTQQERNRDRIKLNVLFSAANALGAEGFIGIIFTTNTALTELPTTTPHMGVYYDLSEGPNFILSSSDGTTQSTTDTNVAVTTSDYSLTINWTGFNEASITFNPGSANQARHTVTALNSYDVGLVHFFVQSETDPKSLKIIHYTIKSFGDFSPTP